MEPLCDEHQFAESILETAHSIILVLDTAGRIIRFNPFLERLSGYRLEEVQGTSWFDTFVPEDRRAHLKELFELWRDGQTIEDNVHPIITRDGRLREIAWWGARLRNPQGEITWLVCSGHDVTELNRAHHQLVESARLAAIGEAMAGLAHESRNALQRCQVCLDILANRYQPDGDAQQMIDGIQRSLDQLHRLYEEVRLYAAPVHIRPALCSAKEIVKEVWEQLSPARLGREIVFKEQYRCVDLRCEVDPFSLGQVLRNVFENSLSACVDPVRITVSYEDARLEGEEAIAIAVRDNGPGITIENRHHVFDSFFTTKTKGTGLGMAIAKRIILAHQGAISINPECLEGTEFVMTIPRRHV